MAKSDRYYHFPLSILSFAKTPKQLHDMIASYVFNNHSAQFVEDKNIHENHYQRIMERIFQENVEEDLFDMELAYTVEDMNEFSCFVYMASVFNFSSSEIIDLYYDYAIIGHDLERDESDYPSEKEDAYVRVRYDILRDLRRGTISENEFRVYCAILSCLGQENMVQATYDHLQLRANGYKSIDKWEKIKSLYGAKREWCVTKPMVEKATNKLEERGFITKILYKNRWNYYTLLKNPVEIEKVFIKKVSGYLKRKKELLEMQARIDSLE